MTERCTRICTHMTYINEKEMYMYLMSCMWTSYVFMPQDQEDVFTHLALPAMAMIELVFMWMSIEKIHMITPLHANTSDTKETGP